MSHHFPLVKLVPIGAYAQPRVPAPMQQQLYPLTQPPPGMTHAQLRGMPSVDSLIHRNAPSKQSDHLYSILHLESFGSGHVHRGAIPDSAECAECIFFAYMDICLPSPRTGSVLMPPDRNQRGLCIDFIPNPPLQGQNEVGVPLIDFLQFRVDDLLKPESKLVHQAVDSFQPHSPGPLIVEFILRDSRGGGRQETLTVDVVYGNCAHRAITRFELGYALATTFKMLVERRFPNRDNLWEYVLLSSFCSTDLKKFAALAVISL
ncbi:hypothetical protein C8F01DRAFT_1179517 [Mycena amicta]|nr:hypothetical protein C8F01DRAFT_1179517 [Mycena amicta]